LPFIALSFCIVVPELLFDEAPEAGFFTTTASRQIVIAETFSCELSRDTRAVRANVDMVDVLRLDRFTWQSFALTVLWVLETTTS
jgi:hypothetical protein